MSTIQTIGVDLAKNVFSIHGVDAKGFLLRNNIQATVNDNWSKKHLRWLTDLILPHYSQQIVLQEMIITISERMQRLQRLDNELLQRQVLRRNK